MYTLPQWRDYFWVDISAQMRRLHRPDHLFADGMQLRKDGPFGEWLLKVLAKAYGMLTDTERETVVVIVKGEENGLCVLSWQVKGSHAETAEREWVLVNAREVEVDGGQW